MILLAVIKECKAARPVALNLFTLKDKRAKT